MNGLKKSAKSRGSQWFAQFAHWSHTGHENGKCGFVDVFREAHLSTFDPRGQGNVLRGS